MARLDNREPREVIEGVRHLAQIIAGVPILVLIAASGLLCFFILLSPIEVTWMLIKQDADPPDFALNCILLLLFPVAFLAVGTLSGRIVNNQPILNKRDTKLIATKWIPIFVAGALFFYFVWPGPYEYWHPSGETLRISRFPGKPEVLTPNGWKPYHHFPWRD